MNSRQIKATYFPDAKGAKVYKVFFGKKWFPTSESKTFYIGGHYNHDNGDGTCILAWTSTDLSKKFKRKTFNNRTKTITLR